MSCKFKKDLNSDSFRQTFKLLFHRVGLLYLKHFVKFKVSVHSQRMTACVKSRCDRIIGAKKCYKAIILLEHVCMHVCMEQVGQLP